MKLSFNLGLQVATIHNSANPILSFYNQWDGLVVKSTLYSTIKNMSKEFSKHPIIPFDYPGNFELLVLIQCVGQ